MFLNEANLKMFTLDQHESDDVFSGVTVFSRNQPGISIFIYASV